MPCSARKAGGGETCGGPSILDVVGPSLADRLRQARGRIAEDAQLDESRLLPAWRRYAGAFYQAARPRLDAAVAVGAPLLIISGAYGLTLAPEPIGVYEWRFSLGDWPEGLLEDCLLAVAEYLRLRRVVAFCAQSTVLVPRACGQAVAGFLDGTLHEGWTSTDGLPVRLERLA
jgi:hypothetical protein